MKLIVGLGNIGEKYKNTRHNVGFMFADKLAQKLGLTFSENKSLKAEIAKNSEFILAKPTTMMNSSGEAVSLLNTYYKIPNTDIYVVHDDLDIKLGEYKLQLGVGPKVHNGITSIEDKLKNKAFYRIRIGVDGRDPQNRTRGEEYVLCDFESPEKVVINTVLDKIVESLKIS